jgi:N-acetylneuraminate synthase
MKIGNRVIGLGSKPLVVAEIGINHNGNIEIAKAMVKSAYHSGCECIKHQTHFLEDEMTDEAKTIIPPNDIRSIWEIMESCCLSRDEEIELKNYTESLGMIYISTPFSRSAADFLDEIGVLAFKIGSGECDNLPLLRHVSKFGKPIIMSTGMQTIDTIRESVQILEESDVSYALLECTNLYPSPPEIVSLSGIKELQVAFPNALVGFSDHSIGPSMALAAAALGSVIIERHYTDSRYTNGPDIICSMDPSELRFLIDRSEEIHIALNNKKKRSKEEEAVYKFARSSIVADRELQAGTVLTEEDIWTRRPGSGEIAGYEFDKLIGRVISRPLQKNEQLKWSDLV